MQGVAFARVPRSKTAVGSWLHEIEWRVQQLPSLPAEVPEPGQWLLVADSSGLATRLAAQLRALGQEPLLIGADEDVCKTLLHIPESCRGVVYLKSLDTSAEPEPFPEAFECSLRAPLLLAQSLIAQKSKL